MRHYLRGLGVWVYCYISEEVAYLLPESCCHVGKITSMIVLRCKVCSSAIGDQRVTDVSSTQPQHLVISYMAFLLFPEKKCAR